jgi:hypothetical protein
VGFPPFHTESPDSMDPSCVVSGTESTTSYDLIDLPVLGSFNALIAT